MRFKKTTKYVVIICILQKNVGAGFHARLLLERQKNAISTAGKTYHQDARVIQYGSETDRRNRFGVFAGEVEQVELEIKSDFAHYFKDRIWHPSQQISTKMDGTLLIKMEAPISPELVTWILGWHTAIKIIKPGSLIEDITQKLEETLKSYSNIKDIRKK